jgi:hypothetical protein
MAELPAEQYRQALVLTLTVLISLDPPRDPDSAERLGRLQAHVRTIAGLTDTQPVDGLTALRAWVGQLVGP